MGARLGASGLAWALVATGTCVACSSGSNANPLGDAGKSDADASSLPSLTWGTCDTSDWPDGYALPAAGVECTMVSVPMHHDTPNDGQTVELRVARQQSNAFPTNKAIFQLAGGPGGSSVWQSGIIPQLMPTLLDRYDLVYVDQRGTGGSDYLGCAAGYPQDAADWTACAAQYASDDLSHDLTVDAANDIDAVREQLGYATISLRGGSYGTRLGLEILRQHADTIVAAALDGILPPDTDVFTADVVAFDRGVNRLVSDCTASSSCQAITTDLNADLTSRRLALRQTPRLILVGGGASVEDEALYLQILDLALYDATHYYEIPRAIHTALTGDASLWDQIMSDFLGEAVTEPVQNAPVNMGARLRVKRRQRYGLDYVAPGLYATVMDAEYIPNIASGIPALVTLTAQQVWGSTYDDTPNGVSAWNLSPISATLRSPVTSNARVLLMNATLDLNTFPEWGPHAQQTLPNATSLLVPYATHETMVTPCGAQIITAYLIADGDMSKVDTSCIQALTEPAW